MRRYLLPSLCIAVLLGGCGAQSTRHGALAASSKGAQTIARPSAGAPRQSPVAAPIHIYYQHQVVILMYHGLSLKPGGDFISPQDFASEIQAMHVAGLQFVTLGQVAAFLSGTGSLPPNAVALTFDDGLESVYTYAYPILQRSHVPFASFLIAGRVGRDPADLSWGQIQVMAQSGLATFGSHTMNSHGSIPVGPGETGPALVSRIYDAATGRTETPAAYRTRILRDLTTSRTLISAETHQRVIWFAYPFGSYDPGVEQLMRTAGYRYAVTTMGWGTTSYARPLALPRINAGTPNYTGRTIVSTVRYIASDTAHDPTWQPPGKSVV